MARMSVLVCRCALLLLFLGAVVVAQRCGIPTLEGVDQSPSDPAAYGQCTPAVEPYGTQTSNWCNFGALKSEPAGPSEAAQKCLKFGRSTIYRGPILGSTPDHKGACNVELVGDDRFALVAVSTKYLKTAQGGWADDKGACGQCMCIHLAGADVNYNPHAKIQEASKHLGLTFLGKVGDRCGECEDDHIDILQDRPLTYAPYNPAAPADNPNAIKVNNLVGLRGFADPKALVGGVPGALEDVGVWTSDWNFVPCTWTHQQCVALMKGMGYTNAFAPAISPGINSATQQVTAPVSSFDVEQQAGEDSEEALQLVATNEMCGGKGRRCWKTMDRSLCEDRQWAECPPSHTCKRYNQWYWKCKKDQTE